MLQRQKMRRNKVFLLLTIFLILALSPNLGNGVVMATETAPGQEQKIAAAGKKQKKTLDEVLQKNFAYRRENRADPFLPFLTEQTGPTVSAPSEDAPLSGMQLFEPGQLTLVAIMFAEQEAIAMVEDSTGMGHVIRVKDKIGRRGEIKAIVPNTVVVEEWAISPSGSKRFTTNEMVLRKEGDK